MYHADEAIIVTNPEISSVRDSDRIIGMLDSKTKKVEQNEGRIRKHLCITRFNPERADRQEMLTIDDISKDILRIPTLGVIPECPSVLQASNEGKPVILYSDSKSGQAYDDLVARFLEKNVHIVTLQYSLKAGWHGYLEHNYGRILE
jgi:septum site-determining protein MinD